ncbi:D-alanine--D-alanine ligase family protein [Amycolatopsis pithecellobii]|uniref:D-alanine--D-alanine ligase n=1 Tax=Amycolatopsis pithecellobii TaxID=664692 RepID=A0A6N7Z4W3_9PSEU|nr:D-alanine--D-alanine ligase [Amycolatopsis pithecellobii]MTD55591.1 D-alanine--D-alanine ligase [Amycolatopsis pithecellobii]
MRVGFTYDLRDHYQALGYNSEEIAEFDYLDTVEAVESALNGQGVAVDRIGTVLDLAPRLVAGERWDLVFNMAVGLHGAGREAQVPALLDAWQQPYAFSDPLTSAICLHKVTTKHVFTAHGLPTAPFVLVEAESDLAKVDLPFPLMAKPVHEGNSKGVSPASRIDSPEALREICCQLLARFRQPVLIESFLPGREMTVGILGTGDNATSIGVMEKLLGEEPVYFKYDVGFPGRLVNDAEALRAQDVALQAWRAVGGRDGGRIDLRSDAHGQPHLLEVNPFPGLRPGYADLPVMSELAGIPFAELIGRMLRSACERWELSDGS